MKKEELKETAINDVEIEEDKYLAVREMVVLCDEYISPSRLQRNYSLGFNRAGRYFQRMQEEGVVSKEATGNKGYKVLVHDNYSPIITDMVLVEAINARCMSYSPYSNFAVGAAVLTNDGKIFQGANIENSSYPLCMCAERNAIYSAYCHGYGKDRLKRLAIVADTDEPCSPCGACRQVIHELFPEDVPIVLANLKGQVKITNAKELLPFAFGKKDLIK